MTFISESLDNLVGGVSQQPAPMRLRNAAERLENAYPSVVSGLKKRPPTIYVGKLSGVPTEDVSVHMFQRLGVGTSIAVVEDGDLKVYSEDGTEQTVSFPDGKTYLDASDPKTAFRFLTIADTTFIVNAEKTTATESIPESGERYNPEIRASVYIKQAVGNRYYNIYINDVLEASYLTPAATNASTSSDQIASSLQSRLQDPAQGTKSWTSSQTGSTLSITLEAGDSIKVTDGYGDQAMFGFKGTIADFSDLPPVDYPGRLVKIQGDVEENGDDYYVVYTEENTWAESYGYEQGEQPDAGTMPHVLYDNGDGTWEFRTHSWTERKVGDSNSNPSPSFIGQKITDLFVYKGRMVFLCGENVVMSETSEYENFYRTTIVTLLDSDPIDIASTNNRTSAMYHGIPFNETILLFSDKAQFKLTDRELLSPADVQLVVAAQFNSSTSCSPVAVGQNVVFVDDFPGNNYAGLREYFLSRDNSEEDSAEITAQVPEYIPSGVFKLSASTSEDAVIALTTGAKNKAFLYNYYWGNQGKVQSSWSEWVFSEDTVILSAEFIDNYVYLVIKKSDGIFLERMDLQESLNADLTGTGVLLDRRVTEADVTLAAGPVSTVTLEYSAYGDETFQLVTAPDGSIPAGVVYEAASVVGNTATFNVDLTGAKFYVGVPYVFLYELSPIYLRDNNDIPVQDGRLQMKHLSVLYQDTSYFDVIFTPDGRDPIYETFSGRNFGSANNVYGVITQETGEQRVSIPGRNDKIKVEIQNDTPFPSNFSSIEWEAQIRTKTRRL